MALVLWLMDEKVSEITGNGVFVSAGDGLSKPMEVLVLPIGSTYNPEDFLRIVKFSVGADGVDVEYIKGEDCYEAEALSTLCLDERNVTDQTTFVTMAKDRFRDLIAHHTHDLDSDILPVLTHQKWLNDNVLVPFWSCSGHVNEDGNESGYICLSGELEALKTVAGRLEGQFEEVSVDFLNWNLTDKLIYMHPVLTLTWEVNSQTDVDIAMTKLTRALESGLFEYRGTTNGN